MTFPFLQLLNGEGQTSPFPGHLVRGFLLCLCRSNTLAILAYHWSFALDFSPYYFIAAWKSDGTGKRSTKEMPVETVLTGEKVSLF